MRNYDTPSLMHSVIISEGAHLSLSVSAQRAVLALHLEYSIVWIRSPMQFWTLCSTLELSSTTGFHRRKDLGASNSHIYDHAHTLVGS